MLRRPVLALFLSLSIARVAPALADPLDDYVALELRSQSIPGLAFAVVDTGGVRRIGTYGLANIELGDSVTAESVFKIGSISKSFLALSLLLLEQDGVLSLDDPMARHIEETPPAWSDITIRRLLSHTAGLRRESPAFEWWDSKPDSELVSAAHGDTLLFPPGVKFEYSNLGYFAAAEIIRRVTGRPWFDTVRERILDPAGMTATRIVSASDIVPGRVDGYERGEAGLENAGVTLALRPSGGLQSNIRDMAAYLDALLSTRIVSGELRARLWTGTPLADGTMAPYGLGWEVGDFRGRPTVGHSGVLDGFRAHVVVFPGDGVGVIVLCNFELANASLIAGSLASAYLDGADLPSAPVLADPDPARTAAIVELFRSFAEDGVARPGITPELEAVLARMPAASRSTLAGYASSESRFELVSLVDVTGRGLRRLGVELATILGYRIVMPERTRFAIVYLDERNQMALFEITAR